MGSRVGSCRWDTIRNGETREGRQADESDDVHDGKGMAGANEESAPTMGGFFAKTVPNPVFFGEWKRKETVNTGVLTC